VARELPQPRAITDHVLLSLIFFYALAHANLNINGLASTPVHCGKKSLWLSVGRSLVWYRPLTMSLIFLLLDFSDTR
jgi:hypothetical protein